MLTIEKKIEILEPVDKNRKQGQIAKNFKIGLISPEIVMSIFEIMC